MDKCLFTVIMLNVTALQITRSAVHTSISLAHKYKCRQNASASGPSPPILVINWSVPTFAGSNRKYPHCGALAFRIIRTFQYGNSPDKSWSKRSGAILLNTIQRPAELQDERKVSTYVCNKGAALCWKRVSPIHTTLLGGTHDRCHYQHFL